MYMCVLLIAHDPVVSHVCLSSSCLYAAHLLYTHTHTHTHMHTHTHTHTCTRTRTHTHTQDQESHHKMLGCLQSISMSSSKLLLAAKALSTDPNAPNVMNQLAAAARAATDAISMLLNLFSSSGLGQKECDNALRNIEVGGHGVYLVLYTNKKQKM